MYEENVQFLLKRNEVHDYNEIHTLSWEIIVVEKKFRTLCVLFH